MTRGWLPALVAVVAAACSGGSVGGASLPGVPTSVAAAGPCGGAAPPTRYDHVVWIWMENHTSILANPAAGYERTLASSCAVATDDAAVGSPSLPNYLGATSGSTWGIGDDRNPSSHRLAVDNLFRQVRAAGGTERSYEEAMAGGPCRLSGTGEYAVKHNPAAYYIGGADRAACQADDVPMGSLSGGALASAIGGGLPTFAFVTPDLCDDTHDCPIAIGDAWLAAWVPRILAGPDYRAGRTAVVICWDEPTPMAEMIVAPSVRPGTRITTRTDHYALLRTTEELLGVPLLGAAGGARDLRPLAGL